jgi:hypothetical protein
LWRQRHRGFESHALRSDLGKPVLTWAYACAYAEQALDQLGITWFATGMDRVLEVRKTLPGQLGQRINPHGRHPGSIRVILLDHRPRTTPDQRRPQPDARRGQMSLSSRSRT